MKPKKPTVRRLQQELDISRQLNEELRKSGYTKDQSIRQLTKDLQQKVDTSMIDARIRLASNIGQMVEAVSQAIKIIVGKENF